VETKSARTKSERPGRRWKGGARTTEEGWRGKCDEPIAEMTRPAAQGGGESREGVAQTIFTPPAIAITKASTLMLNPHMRSFNTFFQAFSLLKVPKRTSQSV